MNSYVGMIAKDFKKLWGGLDFPQKFAIVILVAVAVATIAYFIAKSTEPNWAVLYSDLNEPDAISIVENFKKAGYQYKLSDDKKTIFVPVGLKEDLRVMVAEKDMIHDSNPGFELLDKLQLGATDFQNKLTRQRIFQGELTRTIERISGIKKARVQLADPERSLFSDKEDAPSASVMLILEPGVKLKADQVKAIKNLVAYGIPRLTAEKVFVSDQDGNPLSDDVSNNSDNISDFRTKFEADVAKKVSDVLEKIVGSNNVSVEVTATMNFDSAKSTIERYIPSSEGSNNPAGVVATSQEETEAYGNDGKPAAQTPAALPNANANSKNYQKAKLEKTYDVSKEIKQVVYAPGTVQKMTIAVALNKILTSKEQDEIKNLIISASGADTSRGDIINITGMQFASDNDNTANQMINDIKKDDSVELWVKTIAPIAVVLILGLSALFVLASLIKKPVGGEEVYDTGEYYEEYDEAPSILESAAMPIIEAKLEPELEKMKNDLNNIILSDPSEAARLLLSYIKE